MNSATLITGGAGFIGSNVANRLLNQGERVFLFDNLSRPHVERNIEWLKRIHGARCELRFGDVRDSRALRSAIDEAATVYHFAAQPAVSTSFSDPFHDFDVNARGTLNVLEAARISRTPPLVVYASTNRVYGEFADVPLYANATRWEPIDEAIRNGGIDEHRPLDFQGPYGCSKGAADQYVHDWGRSYGIPTVVFRLSCVYGPRQFGTEDHGWIAHFFMRALEGAPVPIHGDGRQVRDPIFVGDLVDAFVLARQHRGALAGQVFNLGGGPNSTISLLELVERITELTGGRPALAYDNWRRGDQRWYVSDTRRFATATGWKPRVEINDGLTRLCAWLRDLVRSKGSQHVSAELVV
jgi:CDP-paratose 2-epimerase